MSEPQLSSPNSLRALLQRLPGWKPSSDREIVETLDEILESIVAMRQPAPHGRKVLPYPTLRIKIHARTPEQEALVRNVLARPGYMRDQVIAHLAKLDTEVPAGFQVSVSASPDCPSPDREFLVEPIEPSSASRQARLRVLEGAATPMRLEFEPGRTVRVGRAPANPRGGRHNDVQFNRTHSTISRTQFHVEWVGDEPRIVEDIPYLPAQPGDRRTEVVRAGETLSVSRFGAPLRLEHGDEILLQGGEARMLFEIDD